MENEDGGSNKYSHLGKMLMLLLLTRLGSSVQTRFLSNTCSTHTHIHAHTPTLVRQNTNVLLLDGRSSTQNQILFIFAVCSKHTVLLCEYLVGLAGRTVSLVPSFPPFSRVCRTGRSLALPENLCFLPSHCRSLVLGRLLSLPQRNVLTAFPKPFAFEVFD